MDAEHFNPDFSTRRSWGFERDPKMAALAQETLAIVEAGKYINSQGAEVLFGPDQEYAVAHTTLYTPQMGEQLLSQEPTVGRTGFPQIQVTGETTQAAARRLVQDYNQQDLMVLNFASARKPGGGFLNGAPAQEESIARCSGLYPALAAQPGYYAANRGASRLYTDHIIYSPKVPWFRDEQYALLDRPYLASIISVPAPNAGQLHQRNRQKLPQKLQQRAGKILAVAEANNHRNLLLGAWGCGVFKNNPGTVADAFGHWLENPRFLGSFDTVTFAVYDTSFGKHVRSAFDQRFSG